LDSFAILLVEVLKRIDQVYILESDQGFLEDAEVEHLNLINCMPRHFIRKCLKHKHDIYVLIHGRFRHDSELTQKVINLSDSLFGDFEVRHVNIITLLLLWVLLMHDCVSALLHIFKEHVFELVLHVLLFFGYILPATPNREGSLLDLHDIVLLSALLVLLLEGLLESILEVTHFEDTLGLDAGPPLVQEAPLPPLVDNETLLDNVEEILVQVLLILNREHVHVLQQLILLLILLKHAPFLVDVPSQSLVQCNNSAASGIVQEFSLLGLHEDLCEIVWFTISAALVPAQDHDKIGNVSQEKEESHWDTK
jgi:hypothetical protein